MDGPDWGVNVDLCDLVNSDFHSYGKDAVKALKLKLQKLAKPPVQHLTLTALEMCMKNCGAQFHVMVVKKDVLGEMIKLVLGGRCEGSVRLKVLELLEEWAAQLRIPHYAVRRGDGGIPAFDTHPVAFSLALFRHLLFYRPPLRCGVSAPSLATAPGCSRVIRMLVFKRVLCLHSFTTCSG